MPIKYTTLQSHRGFTLIEVLVAATLLFVAITLMFNLYQSSLLTTQKAERSLLYANKILPLKSQISFALRQSGATDTLSESGQSGEVAYTWTAQLMQSGVANHPENFPIDTIANTRMNNPDGATPIYLWRVNVTMQLGKSQRNFEFWEINW